MLNHRAIEILIELYNHPDEYLTGSYFAERFNVSLRTIQTDMREIKEELKHESCVELISQASKGSRLKVNDPDALSSLLRSMYRQYATTSLSFSVDRANQILLTLLHRHRAISFYEMEEMFYISNSTLRNDLKQVEEKLQKYKLELFRSKNKVMIEGAETEKRRCIIGENLYLASLKDENGALYVDERYFDKIKDVLTETFVKYKYYVMDEDFSDIILFVNILFKRIKAGFSIQTDEVNLSEVRENEEFEIAQSALQNIGVYFLTDATEAEAAYFSLYLKGKRNKEDPSEISQDMNHFIFEALESIKENFGIDLTDQMNLHIALSLHCMALEARVKYNMQIKNDLLSYIRETFHLGYDLAVYLGHLLSERYGKKVSDDEIGFLAIHIYSSIMEERSRAGRKKILVITTLKKSMTILLKNTLLKWFSDDVSTITFVYPTNVKDIDLDEYEVILTTEKGNFYDIGLAMYIESFPTERDYLNIRLHLDGFQNIESITALFRPDLFFVQPTAEKDDVLKVICEKGADYCGESSLYEQVLAREKIGSTYFSKGIAVPHPMHAVSSDTFLVVDIIQKPVIWDEDGNEINVVILIHVGKNNPQAFQIWNYFSRIFSEKTLIKRLLRKPTYENFIELIKDVLETGFPKNEV